MRATVGTEAPRTTENCRFCWMCRQVCPVGRVTSLETYTPHAWALTIESVKRGQLTWTREVADVVYACADCGLCRAHCVTDQPLPEAIVTARGDAISAGVAPPVVAEVDARLRTHGNAQGLPHPGPTSGRGATALFVGDVGHFAGSDSVEAALHLVEAAGLSVVAIGRGRASGLLASTLGLRDTGRHLAQQVIAEIRAVGARELVVLTPADRWTFEYVYPARLGVTWPDDVAIRDATDVLAEALAKGRFGILRSDHPMTYAYHDPCHTPRIKGRRGSVHALLHAMFGPVAGRDLFWRDERAHPCGAIGGLEFTNPQVAAQLAEARIKAAADAGAHVLVTEDPACVDHLSAHAAGAGIAVAGLYTLLRDHVVAT